MALWRFLRGWNERELRAQVDALRGFERNFEEHVFEEMTGTSGWRAYGSRAIVGGEPPGPPLENGPFRRGCEAVANYRFSDPSIVEGHFDPEDPLDGRRIALEIKVLGLHYLCGVVVTDTLQSTDETQSVFGFRYDTLRGHVEAGAEWFLLSKAHDTGQIAFKVDARWREGEFPNWWSRVGFELVARRYQRRWHRRAHARLHTLMADPSAAPPRRRPRGRLAHEGPAVEFYRRESGSGNRESTARA